MVHDTYRAFSSLLVICIVLPSPNMSYGGNPSLEVVRDLLVSLGCLGLLGSVLASKGGRPIRELTYHSHS